MTTVVVILVAAGCAFFLGLVTGGMARLGKECDQALEAAQPQHLFQECEEDLGPGSGSFDSIGQLLIDGKHVYSLTLYRDGSGDYTLSDRRPDSDFVSYGGTDA